MCHTIFLLLPSTPHMWGKHYHISADGIQQKSVDAECNFDWMLSISFTNGQLF